MTNLYLGLIIFPFIYISVALYRRKFLKLKQKACRIESFESFIVAFELMARSTVFSWAELCSLWWFIHKQVPFPRDRVAHSGPYHGSVSLKGGAATQGPDMEGWDRG